MAWEPDPNDETHFVLPGLAFKSLDDDEEELFKKHARENDPQPENWLIYHPVCRAVWRERGLGPSGN